MRKFSIYFLIIFISVIGFNANLFADSECKGLSESQCKANSDCTFVNGYTTKNGVKVDDYCRAKPGKGDDDDKKVNKKDDKDSDKEDKKSKKDKKDDKDSDKEDKKSKKDKKDDKDSDKENKKSKKDKKDKKSKKDKKDKE